MEQRVHRGSAMVVSLGAVASLALTGCSGSEVARDGDASTTTTTTSTTTGTGTGIPPTTECPGKLVAIEPTGQLEVVGDGTAESCTEDALRTALDTLNALPAGGTIQFSCGGEATITLTSELLVQTTLMIDGGGQITLSGGGTTRVLNVANFTDLVVERLTISNGLAPDSGGAIFFQWGGSIQAIDVRFVNNHCSSMEGEIGGGGVFSYGLSDARFSGCVFEGNSASNGGGLFNRSSTLTVIDCLFTGNAALSTGDGQFGNGGGIYIDGVYNSDIATEGDLTLCGTVFDSNLAQTHGSGMFSYFYPGSRSFIDRCELTNNSFDGSPTGGAGTLYHESVPLTLTNTTLSGNRSGGQAAGLFIGSTAGSSADISNCTFANNSVPTGNGAAIFDGASPITVTNCTFAGNEADYGPAIFKGASASITVKNCIFANNTTQNQYSALACHEPLTDGGGNIQWPEIKPSGSPDAPCVDGITFADPLLSPLGDNGGPTPTMALGAGSPAIDIATGCPAADQRGEPRGASCDSGAFEAQP
jgi:hypothetical protein